MWTRFLDGVVLCGRLRGGGSPWGERGSGCDGCWVLAWVWVRVRVTAGPHMLQLGLLFLLGLCRLVCVLLVLLLEVLLVVLLLRVVLSFGFRFWFGVGFWVGVWFEVEKDLFLEV